MRRSVLLAFVLPLLAACGGAALLSADTMTGGLPGDRLAISGPLGVVSLAQPAAQTEEPAGSADA